MDSLVAGIWGAYFGAALLLLAGAVAALAQSLRKVALIAAVAAIVPSVLAAAYLGLLPLGPQPVRALSVIGMVCAAFLGAVVLAMLGYMRERHRAWQLRAALTAFMLAVIALGWLLSPEVAFQVTTAAGFSIGLMALGLCVRRAQRGDRLSGAALMSVSTVLGMVGGLTWIVQNAPAPWPAHALSAGSGIAYMALVLVVLWLRYSYLLELREIVAHGGAYDPVTRMRSHSETGTMVGLAFFSGKIGGDAPVGVIVVTIANLLALDQLHGPAAAHHALFITGSRLRRVMPRGVEAGRLGADGFLLLVKNAPDRKRLVQIGRIVAERLARPVALSTSDKPHDLESGQAHWVAQVGVGVLSVPAGERPSAAVAQARAMSRAALGYPSRVACCDLKGQVAEASAPVPA